MTQPDLSITVAGIGFEISLPPEPARLLGQLYAAFPPAAADSVRWRLRWQGCECRIAGLLHPVAVPRPELIPAITTILVGKLLQRSRPSLLFLHGNALVHRRSGQLLLLMGASGAGKTTLSSLLQENGSWQLAAEDLLIVDPEALLLHPFPRAATVRGGDDGLAWAGLGEESEGKRLRPAAAPARDAQPLAGATVVLLGKSSGGPAAPSPDGQFCHWVTVAPPEMLRALEELTSRPVETVTGRDFTGLLLDPLTAAQEQAFEALLEAHGALLLRTVPAARATASRLQEFPERPILERLEAGAALPELPAHAIRFGGPRIPAHRTLMVMARAFSQAQFHRFVSGGSPEQAAVCLAEGVAP